jgi:hypothetical protein
MTGHVTIQVTRSGGNSSAVSGLFFDPPTTVQPPATPTTQAAFVKTDTTTKGTWKGVYGCEGYSIANEHAPADVTRTRTGGNTSAISGLFFD